MRNLISYNSSFIWNDKFRDRNSCIDSFNKFYLAAKDQDKFYLKQDLFIVADSILPEIAAYKSFPDLKSIFPWLTPDSYSNLGILLQMKDTSVISNNINTYSTPEHEFNNSSWMGICVQEITNYAFDLPSWKNIHMMFVMNFSRSQRKENTKYFKKFSVGHLIVDLNQIRRKIRNGTYSDFIRIDIPQQRAGISIHNQQIHIHLASGGALNIDGSWKHNETTISNTAAEHLVEIGFILPENL